jgi:hypothetical protein
METAEVQRLVASVGGVDPACRDRDVLCAAVAASARLRAWLDGQEVRLAAQLAEVVSFPEQILAESSRTSLCHPRLHRPVRRLHHPPHHRLGRRRTHRPLQPVAAVQFASPRHP